MNNLIGQILGHYRIVEKIGETTSFLKHTANGREIGRDSKASDHDEAFQLMIIIMNQGLSSFENATIDLLVDGLIMNTTVLSLEGNSSASLFFQLSLPGGNHTLEIVADGCEMIGESNEDNNSVFKT